FVLLSAVPMHDGEQAEDEYEDADHEVDEIDFPERARGEIPERESTPGEAVCPDEGGDEIERGEARPGKLAHAHPEARENAQPVHVGIGEDEDGVILVQQVDGELHAALDARKPAQDALPDLAPEQKIELVAAEAADPGCEDENVNIDRRLRESFRRQDRERA